MSNPIDCMAWPFLIGRSRMRPITIVVAPRPMAEAHNYGLLNDVATVNERPTSYGHAYYREVWQGSAGTSARLFTLLYHVISATEYFTGGSSDSLLLDRYGRPINLIEGLVIPTHPDNMEWSDMALITAHSYVMPAYQQFWQEANSSLVAAEPVRLVHHEGDIPLVLQQYEPYIPTVLLNIDWGSPPK